MISNQGQFQISSERALKLTRKGFDSLSRGTVLLNRLKPVVIVPAAPHRHPTPKKHFEVIVGAVKASKAAAPVIATP